MTVLIVDDELLSRQRLRRLLEREPDVQIVGECTGGLQALNAITNDRPELVFLDVQMPDLSGVGVVEALNAVPDAASGPEIVFVTGYSEYMERAFDLHALDFLKKPYADARFASTLAHARRHVAACRAAARGAHDAEVVERRRAVAAAAAIGAAEYSQRRIAVRDRARGEWRLFDYSAVAAIEADGGAAVRVYVGTMMYTWERTMSATESELGPHGFVRVHRRWLVNPSHVERVKELQKGEYAITLRGGHLLDTGRSYRAEVERILGIARRGS